jgi:YbgC/YbaW family acyl-CoA thioester hydrolase
MNNNVFFVDGLVRDSEVDGQGGVSNAHLMEYFQHARHEYFRQKGFSLKRFIEDKIDPVLVEASLKFVQFLTHGDEYRLVVHPVRAGFKYHFLGAIFRLPDMKLCAKSVMTVVVSQDGAVSRENLLMVDEGDLGKEGAPSFKDLPNTFADWEKRFSSATVKTEVQ